MSKSKAGVIAFDRYEVNEVKFRLNPDYNGEEVNIEVNMNSEFQVDDSKNMLMVKLLLYIFPDAQVNGYPFEMDLLLTGYFTKAAEVSDITDFKANALAILYPYARAIVSTYTAGANVTPLILPTVNINKFVNHTDD